MFRKLTVLLIMLGVTAALLGGCSPAPVRAVIDKQASTYPAFDTELAYRHIEELASAKYGGRLPGSFGNQLAGQYIAQAMADLHFAPKGEDKTFLQWYTRANDVQVCNVIGLLPADRQTGKTLVVAAHYDHLGAKADGSINYGAADDASGVGVMLGVGAALMEGKTTLPFNVEFVAFNDEEFAMMGSKAYLERLGNYSDILGVVVMDIVGVRDADVLAICCANEANRLAEEIAAMGKDMGIRSAITQNLRRSDHVTFDAAGIEAVHLIHYSQAYFDQHYHEPSDTVQLLSKEKLGEVGDLVIRYILDLASSYGVS